MHHRIRSTRMGAIGLLALAMLMTAGGCAALRNKPPSQTLELKEASNQPRQKSGATLEGRIAYETAKLAEERGMDEEAIANYEKAREFEPNQAGIAHALAVLYDRAGRVDAAEREYLAALQEDTDNPDIHCDYGYFLHSTRRPAEAEKHLRQALALSPTHRQAQVNLGLLLGTAGKFDESLQWFTTAIGPAAAQHNVGMLKLKRGDMIGGREHLRSAAARDPSLEHTQAVLSSLPERPMLR